MGAGHSQGRTLLLLQRTELIYREWWICLFSGCGWEASLGACCCFWLGESIRWTQLWLWADSVNSSHQCTFCVKSQTVNRRSGWQPKSGIREERQLPKEVRVSSTLYNATWVSLLWSNTLYLCLLLSITLLQQHVTWNFEVFKMKGQSRKNKAD